MSFFRTLRPFSNPVTISRFTLRYTFTNLHAQKEVFGLNSSLVKVIRARTHAWSFACISSTSQVSLTSPGARTRGSEEHSLLDPVMFCGESCLIYSHTKHRLLYYGDAAKPRKQAVISSSRRRAGVVKQNSCLYVLGSLWEVLQIRIKHVASIRCRAYCFPMPAVTAAWDLFVLFRITATNEAVTVFWIQLASNSSEKLIQNTSPEASLMFCQQITCFIYKPVFHPTWLLL